MSLSLQVCGNCRTVQYPSRDACRRCLSDDLHWRPQDDSGTLLSETMLHHSYEPDFKEYLPLRLGLVALDSGPSAIVYLHTDVTAAPAAVRVHATVDRRDRVVLVAVPDAPHADDAKLRNLLGTAQRRAEREGVEPSKGF